MKWRFAGIFLLTFAILVAVWWGFDIAARYRRAVLGIAQVVSPVVNGWWLDYDRPGLSSGRSTPQAASSGQFPF